MYMYMYGSIDHVYTHVCMPCILVLHVVVIRAQMVLQLLHSPIHERLAGFISMVGVDLVLTGRKDGL